jgi:phage repressor protein C with HTH and peptisase S24 domain
MQKSNNTRIDALLESLNISQMQLANKLNVTTGAITNLKKRELGVNVINKIVDAYPQVNRLWLMTGEGDIFNSNMNQDVDQKEITKRIEELIKLCQSPTTFAVEIGFNEDALNKKMNGQHLWTIKDINMISEKLRVRKGWLLDGEGQMMKAPDEALDQIPAMPTRTYDVHTGVPFYNTQFELGFDLMDIDNRTNPDYMIDFQPYNKADCWCTSKGNSMHPTISGGDIIALKRIDDFHILMNNEIYGIITVNGLRTIKRVKDNGDTLTLIPDNKDGYDEQVIEKKDVMHVFQVLGCIKMF